MPALSIVIPVFNSEENLDELFVQVDKALLGIQYELILVNDKSRDNSWTVIKGLANKSSKVVGINLRKNAGQDNAIMAGLRTAKGDYIVIMDDDLQHAPSDILKLYNKCQEGFDICYANFLTKKQAWWKNFGSWLNGVVAEILIDKPRHIYLSPFQIIKKEVIDEVVKYQGPYPYIQGLLLQVTDNLTQLDIEHHRRHKGSSNFNFVRSLSVFLKLATSFSVVPLRIASWTGFIVSCIGFLLSIYYLFLYFIGYGIVEGWTTIILVNLIIGGVLMLSLGLIGEYLGRMYLGHNGKPQYVIKERT